ncbi:hypothetical protein FDP41_000252 [Naegleria fowleri]|uniref:Mut7-C RNAse domain-containing protein n=1 Tax=Naegleria fowleri TaxID=5763 RepID=A0A6A5C469_NAEFO|nr:uncharacterized protein FDP41_000252 [Naegleria fowleri]KAF0985213.1 hypothetical protein FDP41_000252 [Naegleria fowleri]CAG4716915.1 unnamed protein product [Naegleria fowleri]
MNIHQQLLLNQEELQNDKNLLIGNDEIEEMMEIIQQTNSLWSDISSESNIASSTNGDETNVSDESIEGCACGSSVANELLKFTHGILKMNKHWSDCDNKKEEAEINEFFNQTKFITDSCITKIAKHIRLLGYDCISDSSYSPNYIIFKAKEEKRIIITCSPTMVTKIKKENKMINVKFQNDYYDSSEEEESAQPNSTAIPIRYLYVNPKTSEFHQSITDIVNNFKLVYHPAKIFTRCLKCNDPVECISPQTEDQVNALTTIMGGPHIYKMYGDTVTRCPSCMRYFWEGHYFKRCVKFAIQYSYKPSNNDSNSTTTTEHTPQLDSNCNLFSLHTSRTTQN